MGGLESCTHDVLRGLALFGGLPDEGLRIFSEMVEVERFADGAVIFREGEEAREIYLVAEGTVGVYKAAPDGERLLVELGAGEFFGEMSFLDMQPRAGTVKAEGDVVLWRWPYAALRDVYRQDLKTYTLLVMNCAREVSRRLRRADEAIIQSASSRASSQSR